MLRADLKHGEGDSRDAGRLQLPPLSFFLVSHLTIKVSDLLSWQVYFCLRAKESH